jgi:TP901 family phage tail tape measure protein
MPEISAKSKLSLEIGAEFSQAELGFRSLAKLMADFRKEAAKQGKVSFLPNVELLKEQVRAGLKPVEDLQKQLGQTIKQAKIDIAGSTDQAEIERLQLLIAKTTTSLRQLAQTQKQLKADAASSAKSAFLENLALQAKAGIVPLTQLRNEMVKTLRADIAALPNRADFRTNDNILRQVIQLQQLNKELKNSDQEVETFQSKLSRIGSALQQAFLPLAGVSAGITAFLGTSTKSFADFERTLNTIQAVSGVTSEEIEKIKQTSLELGQATIFSNQQVAESYLELSKAGFTARESTEALPGLLNLAAAAGGRLDVATQAVAEGMRSFGLETSRTGEFVDILAQGANQSSAEIEDMANAFKQVAPIARQTAQPIQDVSALLAILANNAVKGADAGSDLRNIITRLAKPSKETSQALAELAKHGVNVQDVFGNLPKFFKDTGAALANYNSQGKASIAATVAGQENLKTFLILASQAPGTIDAMVASMNNSTGATQRMADTINQGLFASLEQLSGSFDTLKSTLGEALSPAVRAFADTITTLNSTLSRNKVLTQFTAGFLAAVAGIGAAATAVSGFLLLLPLLKAAVADLTISFPALGLVLVGFATAVGLVTVALNQHNQEADIVKKTLEQLRAEINETTQAQLKESQSFEDSAKKVEVLQKKIKLTKDEKLVMDDAITKLRANFAKYGIDLDSLVKKYGSLTQAIREARIEQATFEREKNLQDQLKKVNEEIEQVSPLKNAFGVGFQSISEEDLDKFTQLQKKQRQIQQDLKNSRKDTIQQQAILDAAQRQALAEAQKGTQGFTLPDSSQANKIKNAQEQLTKQIEKIEEEHTGFLKGEYAKRRLEAEHAFQDQIRQIKDLAKTAGKSGAPEVLAALNEAEALKAEKLAEIKRQENQATQDANAALRDIQANVKVLQASITQSNPFDDITADALKAQTEIAKAYVLAGRALDEQARKNPGNKQFNDFIAQQKTARLKEFQAATAQNAALAEQRRVEEARLGLDLVNQNRQIQAEISGDTLRIEQESNQRVLDDLQVRINRQQELLQTATDAFNKNPSQDARNGFIRALDELKNLQLQYEKTVAEGSRREAALPSEGAQQVIDQLQKEIELYGKRPELVQQLLAVYSVYIEQLERERDLTTQTVENRAKLNSLIKETRASATQLRTSVDTTSQIIDSLQNLNLGNSEFSSLFKNLLSGITQIRTAFNQLNSDTSKAKTSFKDFLSGNQDAKKSLAALGSQAAQVVGDYFSKGKSGLSQSIGSTLSSVFSSLSSGPAAPFALALNSASQAIQSSGGFFTKYMRFIDPLGFRKLFGVDTKSAIQKAQENLENTQKFMQNILAKTDQNDLISLTKALNQINKYTSGGGQAFQVKKDAANQIKAAIKNRKQVIDEALKDLQFQNGAIQKELTKFDDQPIQNLDIDRQLQLDQLTYERDKALEQFKDSLAVQQQIQQNFELKRQAILKQSSLDIIDAIIEEQNTIRSLRAQDAVNQAKVSGNAIQQINAELQARLVAIDNDIASFKGAEETKTEFLKTKASERNAIIKDSNDQVNDLLQQGLEILNEGLVVGETKTQNQQKRLQKLFGSLNPLGLIQADGSLVQSNVTVGAGAIQMVFQGIQDAQNLIAQLTDPIIQNKLLAALNAALART